MSVVKFNPLFPSFSGLLDDFFNRDFFDKKKNHFTLPAANIKEVDDSFHLELAAPGFKKSDFKIELENDVLSISSGREEKSEKKDKKGNYTRREFAYHSFSRSFTLPQSADGDKLSVSYEAGILHFNIPKKEAAKTKVPRTIKIS